MMRPFTSHGVVAATALATILAVSCAAPIRLSTSIDPLALLAKDRIAYARVSGGVARDLAPELMSAADLDAAKGILARTRIVALGLGQSGGDGTDSLQAILVGDYPFRAAALSLGANRAWKREKSSFYNARLGLRAAVPGPSLVVASKGSLDRLLQAAAASQASGPPPSPIPSQLSGLASAELVLWIPNPFKSLAEKYANEGMDVPALGLLIVASQNGADKSEYDATVAFFMDSPESVKIYKSLLKLAWYAIASGFFADEGGAIPHADFVAKGDVYAAEGVVLSRGAIVRALRGAFGSGLEGLGPDRSLTPGESDHELR
jgi:hypothetical protein